MRFNLGYLGSDAPNPGGAVIAVEPTVEVLPAYDWEKERAERDRLENSCAFYQMYNSCLPKNTPAGMSSTMDCKGGCQTTPMTLLRAPGLLIGRGLKKVFTSQDQNQLEMVGHIATALVLIGGTVYLFNRSK